jgi:hypothetical protein
MSTRVNISSSGTIENLLNLGFTPQDALHELIDNSLDAKATRIRIRFRTSDQTLTLADNGHGMNKTELAEALCINNTKPASDSIGLRGLGLKAGHAMLSKLTQMTHIFSRRVGNDVYEVEANWPESIRANMWSPTPHSISARHLHIWTDESIHPDHGTVAVIPMPHTVMTALLKDNAMPLLSEIGRTYETYIHAGVTIVVDIDGVVQLPTLAGAVGWEDAPEEMRNETPIHILRSPTTGEKRVYYEHRSLRPVWTDMVRTNPADEKKFIRDYHTALEEGFVREGEFTVLSTYNREWNPAMVPGGRPGDRMPYTQGYIAPCRDGRYLRPIELVFPSSGDYERRRVYASSRHSLDFEHMCDSFIGVQVNKSDITRENIDQDLYRVVEKIVKSWTSKLYAALPRAPREVAQDAELERRLKTVDKLFKHYARTHGMQFLDEFEQWLGDRYDLDSESDTE